MNHFLDLRAKALDQRSVNKNGTGFVLSGVHPDETKNAGKPTLSRSSISLPLMGKATQKFLKRQKRLQIPTAQKKNAFYFCKRRWNDNAIFMTCLQRTDLSATWIKLLCRKSLFLCRKTKVSLQRLTMYAKPVNLWSTIGLACCPPTHRRRN